jgi:two-component system phosphate regulon sensor histidine kinase PhoR
LIRDVTQQKLADEMRTQFLQTATHELRTPLMNICAYAETLELTDDLDVEQQKQFCNIINSEAMRLSRFVDELLDVNRMEAGAMSLALHETNIERLLQEVIEKVRPMMQQKKITFEANISPKLPKLSLDKDKIAAALVNLLGNAAKYTPNEGNVKFTVDTVGAELEMQVEDTGYGISEEELPKVFDRFFRSDDDRVREISGSGLGLAFTNEVVRLHGGRIDVHSELNRGTKFTLVLPVR